MFLISETITTFIIWSFYTIRRCISWHSVWIDNQTYIDDREKSVWRSEFVECRYQRANNTETPAICVTGEDIFCCYNNALLDDEHLCCSFDQFLMEHRTLLQFIHMCVWINLLLFVAIIGIAIYIVNHSYQIIEEEREDNLEVMKSYRRMDRSNR